MSTPGQDAIEKEQSRQRSGMILSALTGAAVPAVVLLLLLAVYYRWHQQKTALVRELEAATLARNEPADATALSAAYSKILPINDKTPMLLSVIPQTESDAFKLETESLPGFGNDDIVPLNPQVPWPQEASVRQFLTRHAVLLSDIEAAALDPGQVRFDHDFGLGYQLMLPETQATRSLIRLLALRVRASVRAGDMNQAFHTQQAMYALSECLADEPILVCQLVRVGMRGKAHETLADSLPFTDYTDDQLIELRDICLTPDWTQAINTWLVGERVIANSVFANPALMDAKLRSPLVCATLPEDERFYLEYYTKLRDAIDAPMPVIVSRHRQLDQVYLDPSDSSLSVHRVAFLSAMGHFAATEVCARAHATDQCVATQLAIELYRRKFDRLPGDLSDLIPDFLRRLPVDPFDNQLLRYRVDDDAIIVYSIGRDQIDHGGERGDEKYPIDDAIRLPRR